ncbi:hypothetical protein CHELA40_11709 [Chelatococcus asaccharovorans]|nr:hypothetical protein CHELA40_11709 [Chelatococcus asaccharovorans]CAH1684227.1 hypothetical protein CHELA17_63894 [Chelatococcus asaccharovorans]
MNLTFDLELDVRRDSNVKFAPLGAEQRTPACCFVVSIETGALADGEQPKHSGVGAKPYSVVSLAQADRLCWG